jgi:lipoyl(octanoyl) transferase
VTRRLEVVRHGLVAYDTALGWQQDLVTARKAGAAPDTLLLLEHPPVITRGVKVRSSRTHVVASDDELAALGVVLCDAGRGGDVTYHGPGQLVGYPIIDLKPDRMDAHRYVRDLEQVLIRACASFGVAAVRVPGVTGVWVGNAKVAAIGVRMSRWVTSHGFALNVSTDLDGFSLIVPCGLADRGVTSLARLVGAHVAMDEVSSRVVEAFADVFGYANVDLRPPGGDRE